MVLLKQTCGRTFCWEQTSSNFLKNCLKIWHVMFCWVDTREYTSGKSMSITQQTVDNIVALVHLASWLTIIFHDFIERRTPKNFSWYSTGVPYYSLASKNTHRTLGSFCSKALMHLERQMNQLLGRRPRTQETRSLNRPWRTVGDMHHPDWLLTISPDDATGQAGHKEWKNTPA